MTARPYPDSTKIAIIGAGVVGLGLGWRLAAAGYSVDVFERDHAGRGASWAAAGMLAAEAECEPGETARLDLTREAQRRWPAFARELEQAGGGSVGYRDEGVLLIVTTRDEAAGLERDLLRLRGLGLDAELLGGAEVRRREPYLVPAVQSALSFRNDHQVDNRAVVAGLRAAFTAAGARLHERTAVIRVEIADGRAQALHTAAGRHPADLIILAAGAWSGEIEGLPAAVRPPVRPVKGQILTVQQDPAAPLLRHVLWAPGVYFVPRNDGRLIIGSTVEERGFDPQLTAGGILGLLHAAWRVLPGIQDLPLTETLVGFRPGSPDDAPLLGASAVPNLIIASGHHRNGILLLPVTLDAITALIREGALPPWAAGFHPRRFAAPA